MADEKKGITVKIDADLHAEIREYALFTFAPAADTLISTDTKYSEVIMKTRRSP